MEGIISKYIEVIKNNDEETFFGEKKDLSVSLLHMAKELLGIKVTPRNISLFRQINKMYGTKVLFRVILELLSWEDLDKNDLYQPMHYLAREKVLSGFDSALRVRSERNLNEYAEERQKEIDKLKGE